MAWCTDDPAVLDDWLTIGPASQLIGTDATRPARRMLLGADLTVWRQPDGAARGVGPHDELPVLEHLGYLWVCCSGRPQRTLFRIPEFDEPRRRIVDCGGIGVATSGLRVIENFLDMGHFPYVHGGTLGQVPHTEVRPYQARIDPALDEIEATGCVFWQPRASASAGEGIEADYRYRVMQPFSAALYKSSPGHPGEQDVIVLMVQPLAEERVIAHGLLIYLEEDLSDAELIAFQHMIFGQDKPILESHRPRRLPLQGTLESHMRCDLTSTTYRRWLRSRTLQFGVHPAGAA